MIDLHCHILPGVDDGARTLDEAVAMCRLAAADGCEAMIATPHQRRGEWWNDDRELLQGLARDLQAAVGPALETPFRVALGGEIHVGPGLLEEIERISSGAGGALLPLAGSRYLLIEFDPLDTPVQAADLVHELAVSGWRPVIAHPELIPWLARGKALLAHLVALGATVQVTAMSLTGDFGRRPQTDALAFLDAGLVHFVASDSHSPRRRPPGLSRAYQAIAARRGDAVARRLTTDNPRAVLENRPLPAIVEGEA
ncbi:MAG TPA: CpsB/CapC family capsule biosynthesis tyrosine phosphatase [Thermoanaerobaculia bacterium]|jgi:protein-tyrosine phosphatase|nr:CpsB/CapC family capsule biosynthesis tyrosine phosphatase [Thermoanaerobaculia bacterium]